MKTGDLTDWCVFVTGGAGFLGRNLVSGLLRHGANVVAIDRIYTAPDDTYSGGNGKCMLLQAELPGDFDKLASRVEATERPRVAFFHMAGLPNVGKCQQSPQLAYELNATLTMHALRFCGKCNIERFIFPSTGLVYGDALGRPAVESDPVREVNMYAATKIAAESLVRAYCVSYGLDATIVRLSNVYGGRKDTETVVGAIMSQLREESSIVLRDLRPVRDFIYAADVVEGLIRLLTSKRSLRPGIVNLSTGVGTSVAELAAVAVEVAGKEHLEIRQRNGAPESDSSLILDNSVLKEATGWQPRFDLRAGLASLINGSEEHAAVN